MIDGTIGIAGTGRMGTAISQRLCETGARVLVWNRTQERTADAVQGGAKAVSSPAELVNACDTLLSSLKDSAALEAVYQGSDGLLAVDTKDKLFIEMSTVLPASK